MAIKPNAEMFSVKEQIIEDPISGLTFQFVYIEGSDAPFRLKIYGDLPNGNREILFDKNGDEAGAGTLFAKSCAPSWLRSVTS